MGTPSDHLQHIVFEGSDYCVIAPEDYDKLMERLAALEADARRYRWLLPYLVVAADGPEDWTCWLALECIPVRSKESDAQTLLDELMERFPRAVLSQEPGGK